MHKLSIVLLLACFGIVCQNHPVAAKESQQVAAKTNKVSPLERRLLRLKGYFSSAPKNFEKDFTKAFLKVVPPARLRAIFLRYHGRWGTITAIRKVSNKGPTMARYIFTATKQKQQVMFRAVLVVEAKAPHKIRGLWFGPPKAVSHPTKKVATTTQPTPRATKATKPPSKPTRSTLLSKAQAIQRYIAASPKDIKQNFHPSFLKAIPAKRLRKIFKKYFKKGGAVTRFKFTPSKNPYRAKFKFITSKRKTFRVILVLNARAPFLIQGLWFGPLHSTDETLDKIIQKLKKLPGKVSFALARLDGKTPLLQKSLNPTLPLAIGSAFKLYILGKLLEQIQAGKTLWSQTIPLRSTFRSWPSGILHKWPLQTPVTLASLAIQMISISDNTATDHLLGHLGRREVEKMLPLMGNPHKAGNLPFLSTREMFLMKSMGTSTKRIKHFLSLDEKGRRAYLKNTIGALKRKDFQGFDTSGPLAIDKIEWFASAAALCQAMNWLRLKTASGKASFGRKVLSVNKGLPWDAKVWKFVGFKGGSEPGVINMTWLMQKNNGEWYALSMGWNDKKNDIDKKKFLGLAQNIIELLTPQKNPTTKKAPSTQPTPKKK